MSSVGHRHSRGLDKDPNADSTSHAPNREHVDIPVVSPHRQARTPEANPATHIEDAKRWCARFHLVPSRGWMNDPCAPAYDPSRDIYHVGFQWNPSDVEWGHISWGSAASRDLVTWQVSDCPSITPETDGHKSIGVFTGCMSPRSDSVGPEGNNILTCFYTSAVKLPIHFTLPYSWGQEVVHAGTSTDGGKTWSALSTNPVLPGPPPGLHVTGWRDPFVAAWSTVDGILDNPPGTLYGIVSGGILDKTPTTFLYRVDPESLTTWTFLCTLVNIPLNFKPGRWAWDFGLNWEVVNFISFPDQCSLVGQQHDFLVVGVEGRLTPTRTTGSKAMSQFRQSHAQMWICGELKKDGVGGVEMHYLYGGFLDHGAYYATNSFWDPKVCRQVTMGWVLEDDLPLELRKKQGFSGSLSIPRVLSLQTLRRVSRAWKSDLGSINSIHTTREDVDGTSTAERSPLYRITTLVATPDSRFQELRGIRLRLDSLLANDVGGKRKRVYLPTESAQWEINISFSVGESDEGLGFTIGHSLDWESRTAILFEPGLETVTIDRSCSTILPEICVANETAPHTLFFLEKDSGELESECLDFRAFFDGSILELFVNGRTAITTRVYPESATCFGIEINMDESEYEDDGKSKLLVCDWWDFQKGCG